MNKSQLKRALTETETRLAKAHSDLAKAQEKVRTLTQRIPELQQAVNSLRVLVGHKPVEKIKLPVTNIQHTVTIPPGKITPEDALKLVGPQDLTGMGSIPYNKDVPASNEPEELPDVEGEEILD